MSKFFADIGKAAKDLLTGGFNYDNKLAVETKSEGHVLTSNVLRKGDAVSADVKSVYSHNKKVKLETTVSTASRVDAAVTVTEVLPGLNVTTSTTFPDVVKTTKLGLVYTYPHVGTKVDVAFKGTVTPAVDVSAAVAAGAVLVGAEAGYDLARSEVTKYAMGASYATKEYTASAVLADKADTLKLSYHQVVNPAVSVALEVARKLTKGENSVTLGALRKLDGGAAIKATLTDKGILSTHFTQEIHAKTSLAVSAQFDTKAFEKAGSKIGATVTFKA